MLKLLISFYKRRICIPVNKDALVLDIGSGDKPHWRSDVLLDKFIEDKYGSQRSGSEKTVINRPIFNADVSRMPFGDKVFDFVICSHLLEHVIDPRKSIEEIMRVGKAGYIELPYEGSQKISDFPTHLWYCRKEGKKLIFTAKKDIFFDAEIDKFVRNKGVKKGYFDENITALYWQDKIDYQIIGEPNLKILEKEHKLNYNKIIFQVRNILNFLFSVILFPKKRKNRIMLNAILKSDLRLAQDEKLEKRVYSY